MKKQILFLALVFCSSLSFAQSKQESANARVRIAINLMDEGKIDESITILKECVKMDKGNYLYPYEIGYAYTLKGEHKTAEKYFKQAAAFKYSTAQCYQALGNCYSYQGNPQKAIKTYEAGMERYPDAGNLHLEKGNIFLMNKRYDAAAYNYKNGIKADPEFSSNYYRLALLYLSSKDILSGTIYTELFFNLEPDSDRARQLGKYFFDAFKKNITFTTVNDSTSKAKVDMCENTIYLSEKSSPEDFVKSIPLCVYWGAPFGIGVAMENEITVASLNRIRTTFIKHYFGESKLENPKNVLFDFHKRIADAGHFEAYNYFIFRNADDKTFDEWKEKNEEKFEAFIEWISDPQNQIEITKTNYYIN